jgi:catechol 2,3-dioxygenase-like lactoylglutathione lyase family enzyme
MTSRRLACAVRWAAVAGLASLSAGSPASSHGPLSVPVAMGLDHIPVAVRDLEAASATYRALGFSLKPGRPHANGIRNAHVKFPDGAGIELLTVPSAVDPLSTKYVGMIRAGEGPAFLSFHARDTPALHAALRAGGYAFRDTNGVTDLSAPPFSFLFWIADNRSPTDRPEHFAHPNGATALGAIWIATDDGEALVRLLVALGGRQERREVFAPDSVEATVVALAEGEVFILPARHQLLPGRPIIGASFRVRDLATVRRVLAAGHLSPRAGLGLAERVVVEPSKAHGLWLEFVGPPSAPAAGRYLVTTNAIDVGLRIRLCIAVDPRDPQGVWWWQPGASGCTSRSTGPTVFHADGAAVFPSARPQLAAVSFRLQTHSRTPPAFLDIRLAIEDGRLRSLATGTTVALRRRSDLDIPEQSPER